MIAKTQLNMVVHKKQKTKFSKARQAGKFSYY